MPPGASFSNLQRQIAPRKNIGENAHMMIPLLAILLSLYGALGASPAKALTPPEKAFFTKSVLRSSWDLMPDRSIPQPRVHQRTSSDRDIFTLTFSDPLTGTFKLRLDGPLNFMHSRSGPSPLALISAGFFTGAAVLDLFGRSKDTENLILAAIEYMPDPEKALERPEEAVQTLVQVPGRLYVALQWLRRQTWVSEKNIHVIAISLGSLYMPLTLNLLEEENWRPRTLTFAFGGARIQEPLTEILKPYLGEKGSQDLMTLALPLLEPYDPQLYLPALKGPKLVIHGTRDEVFLPASQRALDESLQEPVVTRFVKGLHIDPSRPSEIEQTLDILSEWIFQSKLLRTLDEGALSK